MVIKTRLATDDIHKIAPWVKILSKNSINAHSDVLCALKSTLFDRRFEGKLSSSPVKRGIDCSRVGREIFCPNESVIVKWICLFESHKTTSNCKLRHRVLLKKTAVVWLVGN